MARCYISGKGPAVGNNVSHAVNRTKRLFKLNLKRVRIRDEKGRIKRVWVSAKYIKAGILNKP
jgi:large subunit ribosomal protein L28